MKSFFNNLDLSLESARLLKNNELYNLCNDVKAYIQSGEFTKYKKVDEILPLWGTTDEYASNMLGMKSSSIRVTRRNLSNELYTLFGYDFFTLLNAGDRASFNQCVSRLNLISKYGKARDLLYDDVIGSILTKSRNLETFLLKDCIQEMGFLKKYSKATIERDLSVLNEDKLAYLTRLLNREEGTATDSYNLINFITK